VRRALAGMVVVALAAAGPVLAGGVNGAWSGRFITPQEVGNIPTSAYPTAKLVVTPSSIVAQFTGRTMAAHDPETAISTCSIRFRFNATLSSDEWRLYEEVGKPALSGSVSGGMPDMAACQFHDPSGSFHVVLRVRPAGARLKAEVGQLRVRDKALEFGPGWLLGYLRH
jgi:hypothetical protein